MFPILFLMLWMMSGVISAAMLVQAGESRFAWAPMALMLGPLWSAVALDQRDQLDPALVEMTPIGFVSSRRL